MSAPTAGELLARARERRPLVHSITNYVAMTPTANALLAIGAAPVMAHAVEEVEELARAADALVLNIGTLDATWIEAMLRAGRAAGAARTPVVLDPVGAGATALRTRTCLRLLDEIDVTLVRGNAGEIGALLGADATVRGVDSSIAGDDALAAAAAARFGCAVAVTGVTDHISDGTQTVRIASGHELLQRVTATGCIASALCGAFLGAGAEPVAGAAAALWSLGIAAEHAAAGAPGPGTFHARLYDELAALTPAEIDARATVGVAL